MLVASRTLVGSWIAIGFCVGGACASEQNVGSGATGAGGMISAGSSGGTSAGAAGNIGTGGGSSSAGGAGGGGNGNGGAGPGGAGGSSGGSAAGTGGIGGSGGSAAGAGGIGGNGVGGSPDGGSCGDVQTDPRNCGTCGHACKNAAPLFQGTCPNGGCCQTGKCAPSLGECITMGSGFATCAAYCGSLGESCVQRGCIIGQSTWLLWGNDQRCENFQTIGGASSQACDAPLVWDSHQVKVRCCCTDTK